MPFSLYALFQFSASCSDSRLLPHKWHTSALYRRQYAKMFSPVLMESAIAYFFPFCVMLNTTKIVFMVYSSVFFWNVSLPGNFLYFLNSGAAVSGRSFFCGSAWASTQALNCSALSKYVNSIPALFNACSTKELTDPVRFSILPSW